MNNRFSMFDHDVMGDGVFEQGFVGHVFTKSTSLYSTVGTSEAIGRWSLTQVTPASSC